MKKKIIIVNDNLNCGGIQTSLRNLLHALPDEIDVTLLLFNNPGEPQAGLPERVKIITPMHRYRLLGMTKNELKGNFYLIFLKLFYTLLASFIGKRRAMRLFGIFQKRSEEYDAAISYSHPTFSKSFSNGCAEFVLDKIRADKKICYIHCDFVNGGFNTDYNRWLLSEYDIRACVSKSVKRIMDAVFPDSIDKNIVARNLLNSNVIDLSCVDTVTYEDGFINLISVTRLSPEKGIDRAIRALADTKREDIRLYILGDGPQKSELEMLIKSLKADKSIFLSGRTGNPYRYMKNADYLLVPSLHEAAPMVFDEANQLGLPIISTKTTSAEEMLKGNGIVCENTQGALAEVLAKIEKPVIKQKQINDNGLRVKEFYDMLRYCTDDKQIPDEK